MTVHPLIVRLTHWLSAFAMACMIMSGWMIYDASPLFAFRFPAWATVGGWLGGAIAWHLAAAWLLVASGLVYVAHGPAHPAFWRDLLPLWPGEIFRDAWDAARFRLPHRLGQYNAVQRLAYVGALALGALAVASGLALWEAGATRLAGHPVRRVRFRAARAFRRDGGHRRFHPSCIWLWC